MDQKRATEHDIHELLRKRWSPRAFSDRQIDKPTLLRILEAARWAPSSSNGQPWSYLVATADQPEEFARMCSCLVDANQRWAKNASVMLISTARLEFANNQKPNRHAQYDLGAATAMMLVQAAAMDVYGHEMAGFSVDKAREMYGIPQNYDVMSAIAFGYLGDPATLPDDLRQRELVPSPRKPMVEFIFQTRWGQTPDWVKPTMG